MKRLLFGVLLIISTIGCASSRPQMPTIDLPSEPVKPKITWVMLMQENKPFVALPMGDGLSLLEYLIKCQYDRQMLVNRIESLNKLGGR